MVNLPFLYNRYVRNRRIVNGYKYQFLPFGGGQINEPYWDQMILKKGGVFIDAGANVGGWAIPAARYYERVVAFEANPNVASVLHKNVRANKITNVSILPFALGEGTGIKDLYLYPKNGQDSFLKQHTGLTASGEKMIVKTVALDNYGYKPSVIKIDTEGYELNVLKGAYNTIQQNRPQLCIETHDERDVGLIEKMLDDYHWKSVIREQSGARQTVLMGSPARTLS